MGNIGGALAPKVLKRHDFDRAIETSFASGHDFSRAEKAVQLFRGFIP
jgi:hypothetical protein